MQALYLLALEPIAETTGDKDSTGSAPAEVWQTPSGNATRCLANALRSGSLKPISKGVSTTSATIGSPRTFRWTRRSSKAGSRPDTSRAVVCSRRRQVLHKGIISPVLANMALDGLQEVLGKSFFRTRRQNKHYDPEGELRSLRR